MAGRRTLKFPSAGRPGTQWRGLERWWEQEGMEVEGGGGAAAQGREVKQGQ